MASKYTFSRVVSIKVLGRTAAVWSRTTVLSGATDYQMLATINKVKRQEYLGSTLPPDDELAQIAVNFIRAWDANPKEERVIEVNSKVPELEAKLGLCYKHLSAAKADITKLVEANRQLAKECDRLNVLISHQLEQIKALEWVGDEQARQMRKLQEEKGRLLGAALHAIEK